MKRQFILALACLLLLLQTSLVFGMNQNLVEIKVQSRDTLVGVCKQYLKSPARWSEVATLNKLINPDIILPGQKILVPMEMLKGVALDGRVSFIKGDVYKQLPGSEDWLTVKSEELVADGMQYRTGQDGTLEITFEDGSSVLLRENSLLKVVSSQKGPLHLLRQLRLEAGRIITRVKQATGKDSRFEIETPSALAAARGTDYRVWTDQNNITRVEVLESSVEFSSTHGVLVVDAGSGAMADADSISDKAIKLLEPPQPLNLPSVFGDPVSQVTFTTVPDATAYNIVLATDQDGKAVVRQAEITPNEPFKFSGLADGSYFLLTSSIGEQGLQGACSEPVEIKVRRKPLSPTCIVPTQDQQLLEGPIEVKWHNVVGVAKYQFQLSQNQDFETIVVDSGLLASTDYKTAWIGEGDWFLRFRSFAEDGYQGDWSDARRITVDKRVTAAPALQDVKEGKHFLEWQALEGVTGYLLQIANDPEFTDMVFEQKTDQNRIVIGDELPAGKYFVRVSPLTESGTQNSYSQTGQLKIEGETHWLHGLGVLGGAGLVLLIMLLL